MEKHSRKLVLMIGESGSGKSTIAKKMVIKNPEKNVRISRDDLRVELANEPNMPKGRGFEELVGKVQTARADKALSEDKNVIIDDTNLNSSTRAKWKKFANHKAEFCTYRVFTDLATCIQRDAQREGKSRVGRSVIERQFLISRRINFDPTKKVVIVDLDGTLANHEGVRNVYDESLVHLDNVYPVIRDWVNALYEDHTVLIVSGRHSTCGDSSIEWMKAKKTNFHHIFMRHGWDNRPDDIVKQEILDEILTNIDKPQIAFVIDDRPKVVANWKKNGLTVYPVAGTTDHKESCTYEMTIKDRRCPECWALADF